MKTRKRKIIRFGKVACQNCGKPFSKRRSKQRFCSSKCRTADWWKRHEIVLREGA